MFHTRCITSRKKLIWNYGLTHLQNDSNCALKPIPKTSEQLQPFCKLNDDEYGFIQRDKFMDGVVGYELSSERIKVDNLVD